MGKLQHAGIQAVLALTKGLGASGRAMFDPQTANGGRRFHRVKARVPVVPNTSNPTRIHRRRLEETAEEMGTVPVEFS